MTPVGALSSSPSSVVSSLRLPACDLRQPVERIRRRQDDSHLMPSAGQGVAKRVYGAFRVWEVGCHSLQTERRTCRARRRPRPALTVPMPQAEAALSPAPPATTTLEPMPHRSPSSARSVAALRGAFDQCRHVALHQDRWRQAVPATIGVGRHRAKRCPPNPTFPKYARRSATDAENPLAEGPAQACAKISGSLFFTQASFGAVKPGKTMLPVILRKRRSASSFAASTRLRVSFHRMQGRNTSSLSSSRVAPCIWPERPMPRTAARARADAPPSAPQPPRRPRESSRRDPAPTSPECGRETSSGPWPSPRSAARRRSAAPLPPTCRGPAQDTSQFLPAGRLATNRSAIQPNISLQPSRATAPRSC